MPLGNKPFENTLGKGEIARNEQFLLFPQCFLPIWITFCHFHQIWNCRLQTLSVWNSLKFVVWWWVNRGFYCIWRKGLNIMQPITFGGYVFAVLSVCPLIHASFLLSNDISSKLLYVEDVYLIVRMLLFSEFFTRNFYAPASKDHRGILFYRYPSVSLSITC